MIWHAPHHGATEAVQLTNSLVQWGTLFLLDLEESLDSVILCAHLTCFMRHLCLLSGGSRWDSQELLEMRPARGAVAYHIELRISNYWMMQDG